MTVEFFVKNQDGLHSFSMLVSHFKAAGDVEIQILDVVDVGLEGDAVNPFAGALFLYVKNRIGVEKRFRSNGRKYIPAVFPKVWSGAGSLADRRGLRGCGCLVRILV